MNANPILLLRNAEVYAPEALGRRDILLCGGRIAAMEEHLDPRLPGLTEVDAAGLLALPGLVDEHEHITGGGGEAGFSSRVPELTSRDLLSCGVTTVVGVLGTDSLTRSMQQLLAKTKALKEEGLSAWCLTGAYTIESPTITGSVKGDVCFLDEVLGVKIAINDHRCSMPTREELTRLASNVRLAALTARKPGVVHLHVGRGKHGLQLLFDILEQTDLPIRQFRPTHCEGHLEEAVRFGRMGGYVDITADDNAELTAGQILAAAGMPFEQLTMSSDAGGSIPIWNEKKEMVGMGVGTPATLLPVIRALWQGHGMPLSRALGLVTLHPAESLLLARKGRLEPGADGDLLLTDRDLKPSAVYAGGRLLWETPGFIAGRTFP